MLKKACFYLHYLLLITGLSGCALLEVQIDSQTVPLTQQELSTRLLVRDFAQQFFVQIENNADSLHQRYPRYDVQNQSNILLWKINAHEGMQLTAFQTAPMAALIDTWVFTQQMHQFYQTENGLDLFVSDEAVTTSQQLASAINELAKSLLDKQTYTRSRKFVDNFVTSHPINSIQFTPTPAYRAWLQTEHIDPENMKINLGTMPEALSEISERVTIATKQTPKVITWKAQLLALNNTGQIENVNSMINSLQLTSEAINDFINNNPDYMNHLAQQMAQQLAPIVADIDNRTALRLEQLSKERQAIEQMVQTERTEIALVLNSERQLFAQDLEQISTQLITVTMDKLVEVLRNLVIYLIIFVCVIFFAPFTLGYVLGKRRGQPKPPL